MANGRYCTKSGSIIISINKYYSRILTSNYLKYYSKILTNYFFNGLMPNLTTIILLSHSSDYSGFYKLILSAN